VFIQPTRVACSPASCSPPIFLLMPRLEKLGALQSGLRRKQQGHDSVTQSDIDELRAVQAQVQANAVILAYAQSQQEAVNFLREVNEEISQLLGVDFAVLAKQNTC